MKDFNNPPQGGPEQGAELPLVITPDVARTVELPSLAHPFQRLGVLSELGASVEHLMVPGGIPPRPVTLTRGSLVRKAERNDRLRTMLGHFADEER